MRRNLLSILFTAAVVYALLGFSTGGLELFREGGLRVVSSAGWKIAAVLGLLLWFSSAAAPSLSRIGNGGVPWAHLWLGNSEARLGKLMLVPEVFAVGFLLLVLSDLATRKFTFYLGPGVRAELVLLGLASLVAILAIRRYSGDRPEDKLLSWPVLLLVQGLIAVLFLRYADGRLLFSDDHPSFLYRLQLLKQNFPYIPFYNAEWNAGYNAREFFPSGILNLYLFAFPFVHWLWDLDSLQGAASYTLLIPYLYVFIVPWTVYLAARVLRLSPQAAAAAAILSLGPTLGYFEWMLRYGTLGFAFSAGLFPLTAALALRLAADQERPGWGVVLALLIVSFCCISWTPQSISLLPLVGFAFWHYKRTFALDRRAKVIGFALLFLLLNGPWIATFVQESKVLSFLEGDTLPGSDTKSFHLGRKNSDEVDARTKRRQKQISLSKTHNKLKEELTRVNPLVLLFFIPGILIIEDKRRRYALTATLAWLLAVATFGDYVRPQLELGRLIISASFLMAILAGAALVELSKKLSAGINGSKESMHWDLFRGAALVLLFGGLFVSPLTVSGIYLNRSDEHFIFAPEELGELSRGIAEHGGQGRTVFLGFVLQELGAKNYAAQDGGHIAPLSRFSGKDLYAMDFYHSKWSTVDPIPAEYRSRGREGVEEFLDLINATAVITFRREWAQYCRSDSRYREELQTGRFRLFSRSGTQASYFLRGSGEIKRMREGFAVIPHEEEIVVKFRYLPRLRAGHHGKVELFRFPAFTEDLGGGKTEQVDFVGLRVSRELVEKRVPIHIGYYPR